MLIGTAQIREQFKTLLKDRKFTSLNRESSMTELVGNTTIEIIGASFVADSETLFGTVNSDYITREEAWYDSMSLNVNDIPGGPPAIWTAVADKDGFINSNYGWCIYSPENVLTDLQLASIPPGATEGYMSQYKYVLQELKYNPMSRRATMIYTRPTMWLDYNKNGRSDFMCTVDVQYVIREGAVHAIVRMRSNDAVFGFKNDRNWQQHVLEKLTAELNADLGSNYEVGKLYWHAGSLHVYARHYHLVDENYSS